MASKNVEFFSAFYVSALNDAVKKFLADNNAAVVSVDFKILPADKPKKLPICRVNYLARIAAAADAVGIKGTNIMVTKYKKHKKTPAGVCTAGDLILVSAGVACANCGVLVIEHKGTNDNGKK